MDFYPGSPTETGLATGRWDLSADWERTLLLALTGESGFAGTSSLLSENTHTNPEIVWNVFHIKKMIYCYDRYS